MKEAGMAWGVEPRVLKPRDPEWTCTYDSKGWLRDVYIHHVHDLQFYWPPVVLALALGVLAGLLWGKRFWHKSS